jgi:hypothetical protein
MSEQLSESPNLDELTPEEASRIIHSHRKVRYGKFHGAPLTRRAIDSLSPHKLLPAGCASRSVAASRPNLPIRGLTGNLSGTACWPCRQRKVKCDNQQPCENCVKRDHAQLCSYKPNRGKHGSMESSESSQSRKRAHSPDEPPFIRPTVVDQGPESSIKGDIHDLVDQKYPQRKD